MGVGMAVAFGEGAMVGVGTGLGVAPGEGWGVTPIVEVLIGVTEELWTELGGLLGSCWLFMGGRPKE